MISLHYFNPGSEEAICSGIPNYTPSSNVQRMSKDLACLPIWYAKATDYVWAEGELARKYIAEMRHSFSDLPRLFPEEVQESSVLSLEASPWGVAPNSLRACQQLKKKQNLSLIVPEWHDVYRTLVGRQMAREVLLRVKELLPDIAFPEPPCFCRTPEEVIHYINGSASSFVLKMPFSSSGRGLLWLPFGRVEEKERQWINGAIRKQGEISIEAVLDKVQDFAMEFYSDGKGKVEYCGLSVFGTLERGAYSGNILGSEAYLMSFLLRFVTEELLDRVRRALETALAERYGRLYAGNIGVDMLLYRQGNEIRIYPCVEINMRQTMGMLAVCLSERIGEGKHGHFSVRYEKPEGEVLRKHRQMQEQYPLIMAEGKIRRGYLSLCPVSTETHYWTYIIVS